MLDEILIREDARVDHESWLLALLEKPERADEFLRRRLPEDVVAQLADSLPTRLHTVSVTPGLQKRLSDYVFVLRLKEGQGASHIYVILEHQSAVAKDMAIRTNQYQAVFLGRLELGGLQDVAPVFVVVVYCGLDTWNAALALEDMDGAKGAIDDRRSTLHEYLLCDLPQTCESELAADPELQAGLLMLAWVFRKGVTVDLVERLLKPFAPDSLLERMSLAYILKLRASLDVLREGARRAKSNRGVEIMDSFIEVNFREGKEEGRAEGRAEERVRLLLVMLEGRFGELPATVVSGVKAATPERLDEWAMELLDSERSERLFRRLAVNGHAPAR